MTRKLTLFLVCAFEIALILFVVAWTAFGHGGGLDSNGGHNCNVGDCAGSYHFHRGAPTTDRGEDFVGWIFISLFIAGMIYPFVKNIPKVIFPELRTDAEKRYWAASGAKDAAERKLKNLHNNEGTVISHEQAITPEEHRAVFDEYQKACDAYREAHRLLIIEDEKKAREKRIKRYK